MGVCNGATDRPITNRGMLIGPLRWRLLRSEGSPRAVRFRILRNPRAPNGENETETVFRPSVSGIALPRLWLTNISRIAVSLGRQLAVSNCHFRRSRCSIRFLCRAGPLPTQRSLEIFIPCQLPHAASGTNHPLAGSCPNPEIGRGSPRMAVDPFVLRFSSGHKQRSPVETASIRPVAGSCEHR